MTYKTCTRCRSQFFKDEPWKKDCLDCWIEQKRKAEEAKARYGGAGGAGGSGQRSWHHAGGGFGGGQQWHHAPPPPPPPSGVVIEPVMLRRLLQLCHPDKHAGSESAVKATQWLLELREKGGGN